MTARLPAMPAAIVSLIVILSASFSANQALAQTATPSAEQRAGQSTPQPAQKLTKKSARSRNAIVTADVAQIYEKPDLDAKVIAVAKRGVKLPISNGTRGEYAKFYRTRVKGKLGWVATLDVKSEKEAKKFFTQAKAAEYKRGPFAPEEDEEGSGRAREPFAFTRSVSFAIGQSGYKESINGVDYSASLLTYGLKLTGPDVLLTGPLMDVNITLHYGAPEYYRALSQIAPTGFVLWTDANLLLPIMMREDTLIGLGAGPVFVISNIQASQGARDYGMWQFNLGANVGLTAGMRFGDLCVRLDGKYIFENKSYHQLQFSVGTIF